MYHIVEDQRARRSAKRIVYGLEESLGSVSIGDMTVSRLCAQCSISRATFYRLFDNLTDVLAYRCDQILDEAAERVRQKPESSPRETSIFILKSWMQHPALMNALMDGHYLEVLYQSHLYHLDMIRELLLKAGVRNKKTADALVLHLCLLLPECLIIWQRNGGTETAEEIYEQTTNSFRILSRFL